MFKQPNLVIQFEADFQECCKYDITLEKLCDAYRINCYSSSYFILLNYSLLSFLLLTR